MSVAPNRNSAGLFNTSLRNAPRWPELLVQVSLASGSGIVFCKTEERVATRKQTLDQHAEKLDERCGMPLIHRTRKPIQVFAI
eukprot:4561131-Amphidinium_carterae.1